MDVIAQATKIVIDYQHEIREDELALCEIVKMSRKDSYRNKIRLEIDTGYR